MFVDQGTINEVKDALFAVQTVRAVEVSELWDGEKLGLRVCSVIYEDSCEERFKVYEVEAELIQGLPGILFEFSTRIDTAHSLTTASTDLGVNYSWDVSGGIP